MVSFLSLGGDYHDHQTDPRPTPSLEGATLSLRLALPPVNGPGDVDRRGEEDLGRPDLPGERRGTLAVLQRRALACTKDPRVAEADERGADPLLVREAGTATDHLSRSGRDGASQERGAASQAGLALRQPDRWAALGTEAGVGGAPGGRAGPPLGLEGVCQQGSLQGSGLPEVHRAGGGDDQGVSTTGSRRGGSGDG